MSTPNASAIASHFDIPSEVDEGTQIVGVEPRTNKNGKVIGMSAYYRK